MSLLAAPTAGLVDDDFPTRPFVAPPRVLAGAGSSRELGEELRVIGAEPKKGAVLLVADVAVAELDLAREAVRSLERAGFHVAVAPTVSSEPSADLVAGIVGGIDRPVAGVVGIGGGSAMDAAKLVALCVANGTGLLDGLEDMSRIKRGPPLALSPSTAGTGAEATAVAMLWRDRAKQIFVHPALVPGLAVLDPQLLSQLPPGVTAAGGLDAISHAVESLLSTYRTPLTAVAAMAALKGLARWLPQAHSQATEEARMGTLIAAYHAGLALNASVALGHSIAYAIAARTQLPHGQTCAMALPYCLAYCRSGAEAQLAAVGLALEIGNDAGSVLDWLRALNGDMGIPTSLGEVGIPAEEVTEMARECAEVYPRPNNPVPVTQAEIERLLGHFHAGDIDGAWSSSFEPLKSSAEQLA